MAINYNICSSVIDIRLDTPKQTDVFLVDTNVWYWMAYPAATYSFPNQLQEYPTYLNDALQNKAKVLRLDLSLAELAHIIERTEHDIYAQNVKDIHPKEYRHNLAEERSRVVSEVRTAWAQVESLTEPLPMTIDTDVSTSALTRLSSEKVDGYDLFILEAMKKHGVLQMITDDGDYSTVPGIQVFTANRGVIRSAQAQRKLVRR